MAGSGYGQNPKKETIYSGPSVPTMNTYSGVASRPVKETIYGQPGSPGGTVYNPSKSRARGSKSVNPDDTRKFGNVFFVIAAISIYNAILMATHANHVITPGLGVTRFLFKQAVLTPSEMTPMFVISGIIVAVFVGLGIFARGGSSLAYLLGIVMYGADTWLLWLDGVANHGPSLFMHALLLGAMVMGLLQTRQLSR